MGQMSYACLQGLGLEIKEGNPGYPLKLNGPFADYMLEEATTPDDTCYA